MKNKLLLLLSFFTFSLAAQEENLPNGFSEHEKSLLKWQQFTDSEQSFGIETPPPYPVRHMAEWEELQALAITWRSYPEILTQIVKNATLEVKVIIFCNSETTKSNAQMALQNAGVNMDNVEFVVTPVDSVWIRDYGPNCVYANDVEDLNFIDWVYNRPRPNDDAVPNVAGTQLGIPVYSTTLNPERLVNTGGNFMSDGLGTAFASKLILDENAPGNPYNAGPHTEQEIDQIMEDYMGISRYIKMETLPYDFIHHIDMHMRLLDEETLLVGQYPPGVADGPQIEANLQYVLDNFNSSLGTPYKVVRVVQPPDFGGAYPPVQGADYRTYTNAVFINKTILVPTYEEQYDTIALRTYREQFPGYKVVGINCNGMISASGALHCITKEIGATDPLWIVHPCRNDVADNSAVDSYDITAKIKHRTGITGAQVYYTTDTSLAYQPIEMIPTSNPDEWTASIPQQVVGSEVFYYVSATANSGKVQVRPLVAPTGYCSFEVNGEVLDVDQASAIEEMDIYPNPASAITAVNVSSKNTAQASLILSDIFGRKLLEIYDGKLSTGENKYFFDAGKLASGIYFVTLKTMLGKTTERIIVE